MEPRCRHAPLSLLLLVALWQTTGAHAAEPTEVRVLTYNIHHGEGTDGRIDLERIARVIEEAEPDMVALQECDRLTRRSGRVDQRLSWLD